MSSLVETERAKYDDMWAVDAYRVNSPGERLVNTFMEMTGARAPERVLDAGCGSGRGSIALAAKGFVVNACDIVDVREGDVARLPFTRQALWDALPRQWNAWVYCCDVMEHIPTPFTMLVAARLLESSRKGVFLSISHMPDTYGMWIGKTLHETVQPFVWWRDNLASVGRVVEARDLIVSGLFFVEPK